VPHGGHMQEMICITCPIGCHLSIEKISDEEISVTGNKCQRGAQYAREELLSPKRVVTATCRLKQLSNQTATVGQAAADSLYKPRRVPVRTAKAFPKERIPELLTLLYQHEVSLPVERGQVIIPDALGTGIDVIAERTMA